MRDSIRIVRRGRIVEIDEVRVGDGGRCVIGHIVE